MAFLRGFRPAVEPYAGGAIGDSIGDVNPGSLGLQPGPFVPQPMAPGLTMDQPSIQPQMGAATDGMPPVNKPATGPAYGNMGGDARQVKRRSPIMSAMLGRFGVRDDTGVAPSVKRRGGFLGGMFGGMKGLF